MKVLKGILITLVLIVVLVAVAFVVVINLTPRQLGLADMQIEGQTFEELGIADVKIINIYKSIKSLSEVEEDKVVTNKYDETQEKQKSEEKFEGSTLESTDDYSSVIDTQVKYDVRKLVEYDDVTIAYIFNNIVKNGTESSSEAVKVLKDANISVKELTVGVSGDRGTLRIVSLIELGQYKAEIENALGAAKAFFKVPDKAYVVSELSFSVDAQGKMVTQGESVCVNGNNDDPVTKAIMGVVVSKMGDVSGVEDLNAKLGEAVSDVMYNLGGIGSKDGENYIYGMGGVSEHKLTLVTHVA